MIKIILKIVLYLFSFCLSHTVKADEKDSLNTLFHKKALTFWINSFDLDGGLGLRLWVSENYSIDAVFNGYYKTVTQYTNGGITPVDNRDIRINPFISIKRHIFTRENVTPYIGFEVQPTWNSGDLSKSTWIVYGFLFGVESWITQNITLSGEHAFLYERVLNSGTWYYRFGKSSIALSFYF